MPKGPRGEKRARDPNQLAKLIIDIASGPVVPELYHKVKAFGSRPVRDREISN